MAWIVGIDSYHPVEFRDLKCYLNVCVRNRSGFENKLEWLKSLEIGKLSIFLKFN